VSGRAARLLATAGGLGDRLPAPGTTVGSLAGVGLFATMLLAAPGAPVWPAVAGLVVLLPLSVWACGREAARRGVSDPGPVVLDEVVGQWVALLILLLARPERPGVVAVTISFFLFRAFDVVKPWPIRHLERLPGGWGIVADDLAAGLAAGLVHLLALRLMG
jgi:phosphatidylglycerophosphatase A